MVAIMIMHDCMNGHVPSMHYQVSRCPIDYCSRSTEALEMVKAGNFAPRKAAKHSQNDDPSNATLEHIAAFNSLPSDLLSRICP
jgi:hypothetical protein